MTTATATVFPIAPGKGLNKPMPQADYSLKNFRNTEGREGIGYIAEITRGRAVIGEVADYGDGGAPRLWVQTDERDRFEAFLAQMPSMFIAVDPMPGVTISDQTMKQLDVEEQILAFVTDFELAREFKRKSKAKTVFVLDDEDAAEGYRMVTKAFDEQVREYLKSQFPDNTVHVWTVNGWETL